MREVQADRGVSSPEPGGSGTPASRPPANGIRETNAITSRLVLLYVEWSRPGIRLRCWCAGARSSRVETSGTLLGAFEDARWEPDTVMLRPGEQLVLYTDGVVEAEGRGGRFGEQRLSEALAGASDPAAAMRSAERELSEFVGGQADDDAAMVAMMKTSLPAPAGAEDRAAAVS